MFGIPRFPSTDDPLWLFLFDKCLLYFHNKIRGFRMIRLYTLFVIYTYAARAQESDFRDLTEEYRKWRLMDAPEFATSLGIHDYDDRVESYNISVLDDRKTKVEEYLTRLNHIDRRMLSRADRFNYDVFKSTLEIFQAGYAWKSYGAMNPVNFLEGIWTSPEAIAQSNMTSYKDFDDYMSRLSGYTREVPNYIERMREAIKQGTTNHWVSMSAVGKEIEDMLGESAVDSPLYKPFNNTLDETTISEARKKSLRNAAVSKIELLREQYKTLLAFINDEYKNASRQSYGVSSLQNGAEFYKACLRWHLTVDLSPEEIHNKGLQEVDRIYTEMKKVLKRLKFNGSIREFFKSLENDQRFFLNSTDAVIDAYSSIVHDRVWKKLPKYFKNIPDLPVKVKPMPYDGPGGTYSFGTPDGSVPGTFYVNTHRIKDNPTYSMVALALHEADPGHHLQDIYAQSSKVIPEFRKLIDYSRYFSVPVNFPFFTSFTEGWGLYAESLGEKEHLDIYQNDYELMGRYSFEIFRACRLVVDTGLHYFNWTRNDAIDFVLNYTSLTNASATVEIDRYITWPGQACAYKIGEMKLKELREKSRVALGSQFDVRDFHSLILDNGPVPLETLEKLVDDWIIEKQDTIEKISNDFFAWRLKNSPEFSSSASYKYNDKMDEYTLEHLDLQMVEAKDFLHRLKTVNRESLSPDRKVTYDIMDNTLQTFINGYKWRDYGPLNPFHFLAGIQNDVSRMYGAMPFDTQGDMINYIRRLELVPRQLDQMMDLANRSITLKTTFHNVSVNRMPGQIDKITSMSDPTKSDFYTPFSREKDNLFPDNSERVKVDSRLKTAIRGVIDKFKEVKRFIEQDYMPNTRSGLGVVSLKDGKALYRDALNWHTSLTLSPEEVHNMGLQEVDRISKLMHKVMKEVGFPEDWSIQKVYQNMTNDKRFLLKNRDDTLSRFREIIFQRIEPVIPKYFSNVPKLPLKVQATASDGVGGEYLEGTSDGSRPGVFYANVFKPEYNPTFSMVSLSLHEAIPGHHMASSYSLVSDMPDFRKYQEWRSYNVPYFFPFYNAYVEGWALYSEFLGEEMGIYHDKYELLGRYSDEMFRATRLVVDTGIHYFGWPREQAVNYILNYTAMTQDSAGNEVDRYSTWPGQACGYKIGEMKIKELRKKAELQLGSLFSIQDFHYTILVNGAMPLDVLENVVDNWIISILESKLPECPQRTSSASAFVFDVRISILLFLILSICFNKHV